MLVIGLEQQQQIKGADGTILWSGAQVVGADYQVINNDTTAFLMGEPVVWDPQTVALGFIPRQETTAAGATPAADLPGSLVVGAKRSQASAGADTGFLGVSQEPIGISNFTNNPPILRRGFVAGAGSLTTVLVTTTAIAIGAKVGSSATQGLAAAVTSSTTLGTVLGIVLKINTAGATGTGSTSWAGILVNPC